MEMEPLDQDRRYLHEAILASGDSLKQASELAGMNHAYLQQFIHRGTPRYLPESVREFLTARYSLDGSRFKPPPPASRRSLDIVPRRGQANAPKSGDLSDDPDELALLAFWRGLDDDGRARMWQILHAAAPLRGTKVG